jgi:hypothetical protein
MQAALHGATDGGKGDGGKGGGYSGGYGGGGSSQGGKGRGKKRSLSPAAPPIGARRSSIGDGGSSGSLGAIGAGAGGGASTDGGNDEIDLAVDCRAIIHIVKHCLTRGFRPTVISHSNIIDISFTWHCL